MRDTNRNQSDPHGGEGILTAGPVPEKAQGTMIFMHGRGASAESILELYGVLDATRFAAIAPRAAGNSWYPHSFLAPLDMNQPYLDSALGRLEGIVTDLLDRGIASSQIVLLGFSQGACLTLEFIARHPRRYGAVIGLTGGLIGPEGTPRNYAGSLGGTPVFLGTSDPDPHVPIERVRETERVLNAMGAKVVLRRYPGMGHTINQDEVDMCRGMLERVGASAKK